MSTDLIALPQNANLPAFLQDTQLDNSELTSRVGAGFPFLSIKGKVFTVQRGDESTVIMNPKDPDSTAQAIEVVIVKANPNNSKTYYIADYVEGSVAEPDCMSSDGISPDPRSPSPQATKCAICPMNRWGSKVGEDGKERKACQDNARVAIVPSGQINDPMLLRVPPASLKALGEYGDALKKRGVPFYGVVTKLAFDAAAATPKLVFKAVNYVTAEQYAEITALRDSELVQRIVGLGEQQDALPAGAPPAHIAAPTPAVPSPSETAAVAKPAARKPAPKPAPAPAPAPAATEAPPPPPKVEATSPAVVSGLPAAADATLAEVEALLSTIDD